MKRAITLLCAVAILPWASTAHSDEIRIGAMLHDAKIFDDFLFGGVRGKEQSPSMNLEYIWDSPGWLEWAYSARPYIGGTINLDGHTSHGGAGVLWRKGFMKRFFGEAAFGVVGHNGNDRVPNPIDATTLEEINRRFDLKRNNIEFGSEILFRTQFALGYEFSEKWAGELVFEHLSHGQILGGPENEGSNNIGVRIARRF